MRPHLLLLLFLLSLPADLHAATLSGKVVKIIDGDSFLLLTADDREVEIRVAEIDAPEYQQPYSREARRALSKLIYRRDIEIRVQSTDRHGRTVGRPYVGAVDIAAAMVQQGAAWAYRQYLQDKNLLKLEAHARDRRQGLWALPAVEREAPWDWRHHTVSAARAPEKSAKCDIKGNINKSGERIYHLPGQRYYDATKINRSKGERWFCREADARAAGWRRAKI